MYEKIHNLYTYSFEKKNYINLFIIITMNKKKNLQYPQNSRQIMLILLQQVHATGKIKKLNLLNTK